MRKLIVLFLSLTVFISACGEVVEQKVEKKKINTPSETTPVLVKEKIVNKSAPVIPPDDNKPLDIYNSYNNQYFPFVQKDLNDLEPESTDLSCIWATRARTYYTNKDSKYVVIFDQPEVFGGTPRKYNSKLRLIEKDTGITLWEKSELKNGEKYSNQIDTSSIDAEYHNFDTAYFDLVADKAYFIGQQNTNNQQDFIIIDDKPKKTLEVSKKIIFATGKRVIIEHCYTEEKTYEYIKKYYFIKPTDTSNIVIKDIYPIIDRMNNTYINVSLTGKNLLLLNCYNLDDDSSVWPMTINKQYLSSKTINSYIWGNLFLIALSKAGEKKLLRLDPKNGSTIWEIAVESNTIMSIGEFIKLNNHVIIDAKDGKIVSSESQMQKEEENKYKIIPLRNNQDDKDYTNKYGFEVWINNDKHVFEGKYSYSVNDDCLFFVDYEKNKLFFYTLNDFKMLWSKEYTDLNISRINYFRASNSRIYAQIDENFYIFDKHTGEIFYKYLESGTSDGRKFREFPTGRSIYFLGSVLIMQNPCGTFCFSDKPKSVIPLISPISTYVDVPIIINKFRSGFPDQGKIEEESTKKYNKKKEEYNNNPPEFKITNNDGKDVTFYLNEDNDFLQLEKSEITLKPGETATIKVKIVDFRPSRMGEVRIRWNGGETCVFFESTIDHYGDP